MRGDLKLSFVNKALNVAEKLDHCITLCINLRKSTLAFLLCSVLFVNPMAKAQSNFVCQSCGDITHKWSGHCEACDSWNTITEERSGPPASGAKGAGLPKGRIAKLVLAGKADTAIVEELYLATFSRLPNKQEADNGLKYLAGGPRATRAQDLLWALLNSKGFLYSY